MCVKWFVSHSVCSLALRKKDLSKEVPRSWSQESQFEAILPGQPRLYMSPCQWMDGEMEREIGERPLF